LACKDRRDTYRHTGSWIGLVKYAVERDAVAMVNIPSSRKTGADADVQNLIGGIHRHTGDRINLV
jgi:hypothetical protein